MAQPVVRLTFFKIPDPAHIASVVAKYSTLQQDAVKDGKPYLFASSTNKLYDDARSQGYTVAARTIFHSLEDMKYYDSECAAHADIKAALKGFVSAPPLVVYMDANPQEAKSMMAMFKQTYGETGEGKTDA